LTSNHSPEPQDAYAQAREYSRRLDELDAVLTERDTPQRAARVQAHKQWLAEQRAAAERRQR
jgi:hypothetical protein